MPRRLGQHFLRPESVEELLRVIAPAAGDVFLEIGPGQGALTLPLAERCARVVAVEIDEALARRLRATRPPERRDRDAGRADGRPAGPRPRGRPPGREPPLLRLEPSPAALPRPARPRARPSRHAAGGSGPPGRVTSRLEGVRDPLGAVRASGPTPTCPPAFRPACFSPPPGVTSAVLRARFRDTPRADVGDLAEFERFLQRAFARRRRTLENNLKDSYPNLKEYFRFLNVEGSRRAETLSVVEFAAIWEAVRSDPPGARA